MKILYVCRLYSGFEESLETGIWNPKGAPTIARMISHLDNLDEHELTILLTPKGKKQPAKPATVYLEGLNTPITVLLGYQQLPKWLWKFREKLADIYQLFKIYRTYKKFKPDLVYCDRVNIIPAAILSRFTNARVVWRVMGILEEMHKALETGTWRAQFQKWLWQSPFNQVICTLDGSGGSAWLPKALRPDVQFQLLLNGVDKSQNETPISAFPEHSTKMLFAGRLEDLKGVREFLDGFYEAIKIHHDLIAIIAGTGSLKELLAAEIKQKSLENRVFFLGNLSAKELKYVRRNCDFYISLNKQGNLSNVNLEALSDNLPTIIPSSTQTIDSDTDSFIPQNVFYRFGQVGDTYALVQAISFMMIPENRALYKQNAALCTEKILPTWDERIHQEIGILKSCIQNTAYDHAIIISDLGSGGAQKVATSLAQDLCNQNKNVAFITLSDAQDDFFLLPAKINRIALNVNHQSASPLHAIISNLKRIFVLRAVLKHLHPKTTVSFIAPTNVLTLLASIGINTKVIISERNDPARQSFGVFWDTLCKKSYRYADIVTANSPNAIHTLKSYVPAHKLFFIPNALLKPKDEYVTPYEQKEKMILIVGRLHPQKAHHILIDAFAKIHKNHPNWSLTIVGDGRLKQTLEKQVQSLELSTHINFTGIIKNPYPYYARAQIFVLPSLHEGTPNTLLESMSCGVAPIISDACEGAKPYIEHRKTGLIVPVNDSDALANAIDDLISNFAKRKHIGAQAKSRVQCLYDKSTAELWQKALES